MWVFLEHPLTPENKERITREQGENNQRTRRE